WSWEGPGGFKSNIQNPMIEDIGVDQRGDYFLTVSKYGCTARTSIYVRVSEEIKFILYPNPNDGRFTIKGNTLKDQLVKMEVVDMAGRSIFRDEVQTFRKHFKKEVNTEGRLVNGSYILRLNVEGKERDVRFAVGQ
ncbi:MAG: metallophosphoesterase, partial [Flavipsychrobacter sp.]|nr:metallophosphoesterase [Flavipsychrobacter sp.]